MNIIAIIANLTKIINFAQILIATVRKYKLFTLMIAICSVIIILSSYYIIRNYYNNLPYTNAIKHDEYISYVDKILHKCGDRTAVSIGVVNTDPLPGEDFWMGRFEVARACDKRFSDNCIINLKDRDPSLYSSDHRIGISSYNLFVNLGNSVLPAYFHLRNKNAQQDLNSVDFYPSIRKIMEKFRWYKEGFLEDVWITAIVSNDSKVLYVITLLSAKPKKEASCFNSDSILIELRDFILNNRLF